MGLDAFVSCRCWQDGSTTPPPVPAELIGFDSDGYLELLLPWQGNEALHGAFDRWREGDACPHPEMEQVSERVSNWPGYRLFRAALADAGWEHFPTLHAELPNSNGGATSADRAGPALAELATFADVRSGLRWLLVDEDTGATVMEYVPAYRGEVVLATTGHRLGVDPDGFFVRGPAAGVGSSDDPVELFRSHRFGQRIVGDGVVEFHDDLASLTVPVRPLGADGQGVPERLRVTSRERTADDFAGIVGRLRTLFQASARTGNPVVWT